MALRELWTGAGLQAVDTQVIAVQRTFADFDDYWTTVALVVEAVTAAALRGYTSSLVRE